MSVFYSLPQSSILYIALVTYMNTSMCMRNMYLGYRIKTIYTLINEIDDNPLAIDTRNIMLVIAFPQNLMIIGIIVRLFFPLYNNDYLS